jgi:TatD DNase family protein
MIDTHAHLHFSKDFADLPEVLGRAVQAGVRAVISVGVNADDSRGAVDLAHNTHDLQTKNNVQIFATVGLHPHYADTIDAQIDTIKDLANKAIAIGECGLDYFRNQTSKQQQDKALRTQIELALEHDMALIFHVRDAWDDFFSVLDDYPKLCGVIHSFTGHPREVERALAHDGELYFGLNGIMTFTQDDAQLEAAKLIPTERILIETDAPYLAPVPHRGKRNEPAFVSDIVQFLSVLRGMAVEDLARQTGANAEKLFRIKL